MGRIREVTVTRYLQPLREGGSLPALAETCDARKYVIKFRGSGHGVKMLIAELVGGEMARALGLKVPEIVYADLDERFGNLEGDEEIQDLLKASKGLNLGLEFISGAFAYDPVVTSVDPDMASEIVWLDSFITNVDRSFRNTNMLVRNRELWLIDHGSSLFFHYNWDGWEQKATGPFKYIKDHVLLRQATKMEEANRMCRELISAETIRDIVHLIPDDWLHWKPGDISADEIKQVYYDFLVKRLDYSPHFTKEASDAAQTLI